MKTILGPSGKPMRLIADTRTTPVADSAPKPLIACDDPNDAIPIAEFIVFEMRSNPFTPEGQRITRANAFDVAFEIRQWHAQPWYAKLGRMPDFAGMARGKKAAAYAMWTERVAPKHWWDHKWRIQKMIEDSSQTFEPWHKYGQYDYYYDIWSNIHYGYVGSAVGFTASELLSGAGLAQAGSDSFRAIGRGRWPKMQHHSENGPWPASADDIPDHISIRLGIDLYAETKPSMLSTNLLLRTVSVVPLPWGKGKAEAKRVHACKG